MRDDDSFFYTILCREQESDAAERRCLKSGGRGAQPMELARFVPRRFLPVPRTLEEVIQMALHTALLSSPLRWKPGLRVKGSRNPKNAIKIRSEQF